MKSLLIEKLKQTFRPRKAPAELSSSPSDTHVSIHLPGVSDETLRSEEAPTLIGAETEHDPLEDLTKPRHYKLGGEVAHGGMGAILRAKDLNIRRTVAMKVIRAGREVSEDFFRRF